MITGCDISSNNLNYQSIISARQNQFVIIKATEGRTYKSPLMNKQADTTLKAGKLIGFYHYARPENGNTAVQEAEAFIAAVKPYIGKAILALDYEGNAHKCGQQWAVDFINYVFKRTGVRPLFYTSESFLNRYDKVADTDAGLWVAKYSIRNPKIGAWKFKAIWQYSSSPYDKDRFYGTSETWAAYAKVRK